MGSVSCACLTFLRADCFSSELFELVCVTRLGHHTCVCYLDLHCLALLLPALSVNSVLGFAHATLSNSRAGHFGLVLLISHLKYVVTAHPAFWALSSDADQSRS